MILLINPGSGDVPSERLSLALKNVRAFRRELLADTREVEIVRDPTGDERGRYSFVLVRGAKQCTVDMPGCDIELLRDMAYRLYVDGSSWFWPFALSRAADYLGLPEPRTT